MVEKKEINIKNLSDNENPDTFIEKDIGKNIKNNDKKEEKENTKNKISDIDFV